MLVRAFITGGYTNTGVTTAGLTIGPALPKHRPAQHAADEKAKSNLILYKF